MHLERASSIELWYLADKLQKFALVEEQNFPSINNPLANDFTS